MNRSLHKKYISGMPLISIAVNRGLFRFLHMGGKIFLYDIAANLFALLPYPFKTCHFYFAVYDSPDAFKIKGACPFVRIPFSPTIGEDYKGIPPQSHRIRYSTQKPKGGLHTTKTATLLPFAPVKQ